MRILVITRAPWKNDNGTGSTLTDFFQDFTRDDFYGLCLREAPEVVDICKKNFYITEGQIIKYFFKNEKVGKLTNDNYDTKNQESETKTYNKAKQLNWTILRIFREFLWQTGVWKNDGLNKYLEEVNPDVIFFPDFPCLYAHKVLKYVKSNTNAKMAIYHADDCYTLKQFSLSPLFWIYRLYQRKWVRSSVRLSDFHYVISDIQKENYDRAFKKNHKVLTKFGDFSSEPNYKTEYNFPIQIVYTGNIALNRWKSLKIIADSLTSINSQGTKAELRFYTVNEITKEIKKALDIPGSSYLMGKASASEIPAIQENADILVHVESMDIKNRLIVRQSFSTKIVDYFKHGRAILAVGPKEVASIKHLMDNNCAIVADNQDDLIPLLNEVIVNNDKLQNYAEKAYICGKKYHNKDQMISILREDLLGK